MAKGKGGGEGTYHTSQKNEILTSLTGILLSFDLRKSEGEEEGKRTIIWFRNYLLSLMSLLLVSNDVKHHRKENHVSHIAKIVYHESCC